MASQEKIQEFRNKMEARTERRKQAEDTAMAEAKEAWGQRGPDSETEVGKMCPASGT